ncbi:HNH endonuclease [Gottfriedia sp. NPDC057948]|uniref:HNH endonuclease n=1 Tax=Gottfriedia sp. NPDC057948 TaxID=3346287 RepID=UPI0036D75D86
MTFSKVSVPQLEPVKRAREYNLYDDSTRDRAIFEYLFNSESHRWIDEHVIGLKSNESRGYQAMGILHFIGLKNIHKGIFNGKSIQEAILILEDQKYDFNLVLDCLYRLTNQSKKSWNLVDIIFEDIESEKAEEESYYTDGAVKKYYGKRFERNPENRRKAIEIHGLNCFACGFNFEKVYGERGMDFIEVHHLKPLSTLGEEVIINPKEDLVPVCSNCHRMIHRRKDHVLSIEELKAMIIRKDWSL